MLICLTWRNYIKERVMRQGQRGICLVSSPHFLSLSLSKCLSIFTIFIPFCLVITSKLRYMFLARLVRKRILELVCFPSECCYYIPARLPEGIYKVTTQTNCFLCPNSQTITTFFLYIISIQSIFWNPKLIAISATLSIALCPDQRRQLLKEQFV